MRKFFLPLLMAASFAAVAQPVSNKLAFKKGQKLEVTTQVASVASQEMMGQSIDINVAATLNHSYDVEDVTAAGAVIEHKVKRLQLSFDGMGQSEKFDSENEADMKGDMGKAAEKSIKNKYTMTVDASGNVVSVKADDDNPNTAGGGEDMMSQMLSQLSLGLDMPKQGDPTPFKILPATGNLAKGYSWTDSLNKNEEKGFHKYTIADVTDNEVLIDFTGQTSSSKQQEAQGMEMTILMESKQTGKITLDKKTGLLKQRTVTTDGAGSVEVAGQSLPITNKITVTTTVNGIQ
ncbi:MAG: DUF6263 family protein [Chitinophagaceae bacterium]